MASSVWFEKFISITRTIFFSQYSEQFRKQNTIAELHLLLKLTPVKTKTWIFKQVLDPGHGGCFRGRIAICFDFLFCTVYLMAKFIFPKPLLKSAMTRCLQKIRGKVNKFEKATKISQLLFELTIINKLVWIYIPKKNCWKVENFDVFLKT